MNLGTAASGYDAEEIQEAGYSDWRQVAGYYDGDGGEELKIGKFVIRFAITWSDTYLPQLQHIQTFLISEKLAPSRIKLGSSTIGRKAWHLSLWEKGGMLEACKKMLPFLDKKRIQVKTLLDYMESRITANDALRTFNLEHTKGKWAGKVRSLNMPCTRNEALRYAHDLRILTLRPSLTRILQIENEEFGPTVNFDTQQD
jgi:hypothetical protein